MHPKDRTTTGLTLEAFLEASILNGFRIYPRSQATTLLVRLDELMQMKNLPDNPHRRLGSKKDSPAFHAHIQEMAKCMRTFFRSANSEEAQLFTDLLLSRRVTIGPIGRDQHNRSTRALCTRKGRLIFD